jgi:two-component system, sensor histidine kinase YesM
MKNTFFTRLIAYFLLISLVPIIFLSFYYYTSVSRTLRTNLTDQAEESISRTLDNYVECFEEYRHNTYQLANSQIIQQALSSPGSTESNLIYQEIYSIMRGKIYDASAHIVSPNGKIRYSTHEFPSLYDFRYNSNDSSMLSILSTNDSTTLLLSERYVNNRNDVIMMNFVRSILDNENNLIGYAIIDLFAPTLNALCEEKLFSDLVLIDTKTLKAKSLIHTEVFGDYSSFPALQTLQALQKSTSSRKTETDAGSNFIVAKGDIPGTNLELAGIVETSSYRIVLNNISITATIVMIASILAAFLLSFITSKHITKPISSLVKAMKQVEDGKLDVQMKENGNSEELLALQSGFNDMVSQIRELIELTKEEERQLREAERKALQAQINPHFLYNTLYTIKALAKLHGEEQILTISTKLGQLLRNAIDSTDDVIPLGDSFNLVESYLVIQQIRFQDKLKTTIYIDESINSIPAPKLIIQPFVENAITHGLEPKLGIWKLQINAFQRNKYIHILIQDNGVGFDSYIRKSDLHNRKHIGLENVRKRLDLFYSGKASLKVTSKINVGTVIRIMLPASEE